MKTSKIKARIAGIILAGITALSFAGCKEKGAETSSKGGASNIEKLKAGTPAPESDFEVTLTNDGNGVIINEYKGNAKNIVIPSTIQGMPVIVAGGFSNKELKSVVIPEGVKKIDDYAFFECGNLTTVVLPSSLRVIDYQAFSGCKKLTSLNFPEGLVWIRAAFYDSGLTSVTLPKSLKIMELGAFDGSDELSEINIPEGLNIYAFWPDILKDEPVTFDRFFSGTKIEESIALQKLLREYSTVIPGEEDEEKFYDYLFNNVDYNIFD
ncbi:MAG: leucine-rich repeat domain-containing protein [Spirochaetales bacterium]|nr:leucine-rich repeat domain-containing protein [Spirochaetales bacterium]